MASTSNHSQWLAEIDELIRTMPPRGSLPLQENFNLEWLGRVGAVLQACDPTASVDFNIALIKLHGVPFGQDQGETAIIIILRRVQYSLQMLTTGPRTAVVPEGRVFDYFEGIRQIVEQATTNVFFVDPYLNPEFVARYLPLLKPRVQVRLLSTKNPSSLVAAATLFAAQSGTSIEIRSTPKLHDRFVFIDGQACYQSGASFKDGARKSPVTVTQIVDAFAAMCDTYESLWAGATVEM